MESNQKEIITKIEQGKIKMKPRIYFILGGILLGAGLGITLLLAIFISNVGFYNLFVAGRVSVPAIILITFFIVMGVFLLKQYEFSYKKDFPTLALLLAGGVLIIGLLLSQTKINTRARKIPHLRMMYDNGYMLPMHRNQLVPNMPQNPNRTPMFRNR